LSTSSRKTIPAIKINTTYTLQTILLFWKCDVDKYTST
jgi:hypothetical protein